MSNLMQDRYGAVKPRRRRVLILVSTAVGALFLGWLAWVVVDVSNPAVRVEIVSFDVKDRPHNARFTIEAKFRNNSVQGSCTFGATAENKTPVGDLSLTFDQMRAAGSSWIEIQTLEQATTVVKKSCTSQ